MLQDNTLDWDSKLPEDELEAAIDHADKAVSGGGDWESHTMERSEWPSTTL